MNMFDRAPPHYLPSAVALCALVSTRARWLSVTAKWHVISRARAGRAQSGRLAWLVLLLLGGLSGAPGALANSLSVTHAYAGLSTSEAGTAYTSTLNPSIQLLGSSGEAVTGTGVAILAIAGVMVTVAGNLLATCWHIRRAPPLCLVARLIT